MQSKSSGTVAAEVSSPTHWLSGEMWKGDLLGCVEAKLRKLRRIAHSDHLWGAWAQTLKQYGASRELVRARMACRDLNDINGVSESVDGSRMVQSHHLFNFLHQLGTGSRHRSSFVIFEWRSRAQEAYMPLEAPHHVEAKTLLQFFLRWCSAIAETQDYANTNTDAARLQNSW